MNQWNLACEMLYGDVLMYNLKLYVKYFFMLTITKNMVIVWNFDVRVSSNASLPQEQVGKLFNF